MMEGIPIYIGKLLVMQHPNITFEVTLKQDTSLRLYDMIVFFNLWLSK